jgi:uncharacterized oxidoreductase
VKSFVLKYYLKFTGAFMNIDHHKLTSLVRKICIEAGTPQLEAEQVAGNLVEANLLGHDSHGVGMLPIYIRNINKGLLKPAAHIELINEQHSLLMLDGQFGFGQVVGPEAMVLAIDNARRNGVCLMTLKNAHHLGRIGHMGEQAAAEGLISMHYVNVVGINPLVAPFGGSTGKMSTNPFCCAIPMGSRAPFIFDMATSTIALGKARVAHNSGVPVADGCLVDHQGLPTNDPSVMFSEPMGALTYIGAHKGFGLAMVCELLAGALIGQWTAQDERPIQNQVVNHMLTIVIDPAALGDLQGFVSEAEKLADYIKQSPPAEGVDSVLIPGEPERQSKQARLAHGIEIDSTTWKQLIDTAQSLGISEADL